jgi:DNA-binding NtrC family response regulator
MIDPSKHILVVDDDGDVLDVIVEILRDHGYRVSAASGGLVMREFLATADAVDCVILDALMLGEASVLLALHVKEARIPMVMISGSHEAMTFAEENGLQLLRKPFHAQELYDAVNMAIASGDFGRDHEMAIELIKTEGAQQMFPRESVTDRTV